MGEVGTEGDKFPISTYAINTASDNVRFKTDYQDHAFYSIFT